MELLMLVLLELPLELLANMLQTRSSTPVQEVVPGSKIQTTEFLVEILETFFWSYRRICRGINCKRCCWKSMWEIKYHIMVKQVYLYILYYRLFHAISNHQTQLYIF